MVILVFDALKKILEPFLNNYILIFIIIVWLLLGKMEISNKNLRAKFIVVYLFLYSLALFRILSVWLILFFFIMASFIILELFFIDDFARTIMKNCFYYTLDYIYKVIFEYKFLYLVGSLFLVFVAFKCKSIIQAALIVISLIILFVGIIKCMNNEFSTFNFSEINAKILKIKKFSQFKATDKLKDFSKILIYVEDKSFLYRVNTYNWLSHEFFAYKIKKAFKNRGNILKRLGILIKKGAKQFYNLIVNVLIRRKSIKKYLRGYSTIEMQLIRTIALKSGYSCFFQRKVFEFIYSYIYFSALKKYYIHNVYENIKDFKYYILYLYIMVAPVKINNVPYDNILKMCNKTKFENINKEEFFIWTRALSHKSLNGALDSIIVKEYSINEKELSKLIKKFENKNSN